MSIIHDALKKVARDHPLFRNQSNLPASLLNEMNKIKMKPKSLALKKWLLWTGAGALCLLALISVINLEKDRHLQTVPPASPAVQQLLPQAELSPPAFPPGQELVQAPRVAPLAVVTPTFNLSGILYDQEKPLAIINQRVVGVGTSVDGAKLMEIHPDYVKLSLEGKELTLEIK